MGSVHLRLVGTIEAERVAELSEGRLRLDIPIRINRAVVEADLTLIVGPVFLHEVVGFSGGNKYLFPGVSGRELIDPTTHPEAVVALPSPLQRHPFLLEQSDVSRLIAQPGCVRRPGTEGESLQVEVEQWEQVRGFL